MAVPLVQQVYDISLHFTNVVPMQSLGLIGALMLTGASAAFSMLLILSSDLEKSNR